MKTYKYAIMYLNIYGKPMYFEHTYHQSISLINNYLCDEGGLEMKGTSDLIDNVCIWLETSFEIIMRFTCIACITTVMLRESVVLSGSMRHQLLILKC